MTTRRLFLAALSTAAAATAVPAVASAAEPVWEPSAVTSNPGGNAVWPRVAMAPNGGAVLAYGQEVGSDFRLAVKTRNADGTWSDAEYNGYPDGFVSPPGEDINDAGAALLTGAADGTLAVSWLRHDSQVGYMLIKRPGEGWMAPAGAGPESGEQITGASMAAGPNGSTVLFTTSVLNTGHNKIRVRQRAAGSSEFTITSEIPVPTDSDTGNDLYNPRSPWIAYNSHGDGVAVWRAESSEEIYSARYAVADNQWTTPVLVRAGGTGVDGLSVAINDAGEAAAIWNNSSGFYGASMAGQASPGASWGAAHPVMVSGPHLVMPQIQADQAGNFVGAWQEFSFFDASVMPIAISRTLRPSTDTLSGMPAEDGDPETGENIADTFGGAPTLAVNTAGTMVASAMYLGESFSPNVGVAYRANGSSEFDAMREIESDNIAAGQGPGVPHVAIDADGDALVAFPRMDDGTVIISTAYGNAPDPTSDDVAPAPEPPASVQEEDAPTVVLAPKKKPVDPPMVTLRGKVITIKARVILNSGQTCSGKAQAKTTIRAKKGSKTTTTYRTMVNLKIVKLPASGRSCLAIGSIKLRKAPPADLTVKVGITGSKLLARPGYVAVRV